MERGDIGGSEVDRDQRRGPGIHVVCCCQFPVCPVRFACVSFFLYESSGLLSVRSTGLRMNMLHCVYEFIHPHLMAVWWLVYV